MGFTGSEQILRDESPGAPTQIFTRKHPDWVAAAFASVVFSVMVVPLLVGNMLCAWFAISLIGIRADPWFKWGILLLGTIPAALISYYVARKAYFNTKWQPFDPSLKKCRICAYDLTGNVSGVCSECGTPILQMTGSASGEGC